jgi:hypothetical protein
MNIGIHMGSKKYEENGHGLVIVKFWFCLLKFELCGNRVSNKLEISQQSSEKKATVLRNLKVSTR